MTEVSVHSPDLYDISWCRCLFLGPGGIEPSRSGAEEEEGVGECKQDNPLEDGGTLCGL